MAEINRGIPESVTQNNITIINFAEKKRNTAPSRDYEAELNSIADFRGRAIQQLNNPSQANQEQEPERELTGFEKTLLLFIALMAGSLNGTLGEDSEQRG